MNDELISCILLPLSDDYLLLPNVAVAEVIAYIEPSDANSENSMIGFINWRGVSVPIICFEKASGLANKENKENSIRERIAILYNPDGDENKPYVGVKLLDNPKSFRAEVDSLVDETITVDDPSYISNQLSDAGRRLFIPNLDAMFERLI